jgi:hypothetical protein
MAVAYSAEVCARLRRRIDAAGLERPARVDRYDPGELLEYEMTAVCPAGRASVTVEVEKFVGGGFAGQVYRVLVRSIKAPAGAGVDTANTGHRDAENAEIDRATAEDSSVCPSPIGKPPSPLAVSEESPDASPQDNAVLSGLCASAAHETETIPSLRVGQAYAMKILVPPSRFSVRFRNLIYAVGFQGPFSLQVNPAAARAGALWQKFIRRAAAAEFASERAVCDILATFIDERIGSCGEISEWIAGRTWRFEVEDRLGTDDSAGRPEYRAKKQFMARFVRLLHAVGAPELARQYEWWTCKSQPNCLKRLDAEADPAAGLTAVDFRAGLALLPFLPMSPGDVPLIFKGIARGSLVQFDRGNLDKLESYVRSHPEAFADMREALEELRVDERIYRDSQIDLTHNHVRLVGSSRLWGQILDSAVTGWRVRGMIDDTRAERLGGSRLMTLLFAAVGVLASLGSLAALAGLAAIAWGVFQAVSGRAWSETTLPAGAALLVGGAAVSRLLRFLRTLWGRDELRRHYGRMLRDRAYLGRAVRAHVAEELIGWHRAGRVSAERAQKLAASPPRFFAHRLAVAWLPAGLHRTLTDRRFAWEHIKFIVARPVRLYFHADAREQWMREMIDDGVRQGMLTDAEAEHIRGRLGEPFIQKYLKALAVHVCTLPITQMVSVAVAIFVALRYGQSWQESWGYALGILALFQITPISPGSLTRGLYVVWLVIRERNYSDYKLAFWLGFWKYIGYLSFPIQMAYSYPAIARFMAGRWATGAVHIVPVFGEHGALLEHAVFDLFYNWPLTLRRRMAERAALRAGRPTRWWPLPLAALACWALIAQLPTLLAMTAFGRWRLHASLVPAHSPVLLLAAAAAGGFIVSRSAGGAGLARRILLGLVCGAAIGFLQIAAALACWAGVGSFGSHLTATLKHLALPVFLAAVLAALAAFVADVFRSPPRQRSL